MQKQNNLIPVIVVTLNIFCNVQFVHSRALSEIPDPKEVARLTEGDMILPMGRNALKDDKSLWHNATVPYIIDETINEDEFLEIQNAMYEFHEKTCIKFVPRSDEKDYVHIMKEDVVGCSSDVGRIGGKQVLTLDEDGCYFFGVIIHELMHTIGFFHEQSRYDRDEYIDIFYDNIKEEAQFNFNKLDWDYIRNLKLVVCFPFPCLAVTVPFSFLSLGEYIHSRDHAFLFTFIFPSVKND